MCTSLNHLEKLRLFRLVEGNHLAADNRSAIIERKHILDKRLFLSLTHDHVRYLDHRILLGLRKDAFPTGTLNIKTQNPQRRNLLPLPLRGMNGDLVPRDIELNLAFGGWRSRICASFVANGSKASLGAGRGKGRRRRTSQ